MLIRADRFHLSFDRKVRCRRISTADRFAGFHTKKLRSLSPTAVSGQRKRRKKSLPAPISSIPPPGRCSWFSHQSMRRCHRLARAIARRLPTIQKRYFHETRFCVRKCPVGASCAAINSAASMGTASSYTAVFLASKIWVLSWNCSSKRSCTAARAQRSQYEALAAGLSGAAVTRLYSNCPDDSHAHSRPRSCACTTFSYRSISSPRFRMRIQISLSKGRSVAKRIFYRQLVQRSLPG